ncbi:MAG: amidohydrolase family protein [Pirellulales bacterium]
MNSSSPTGCPDADAQTVPPGSAARTDRRDFLAAATGALAVAAPALGTATAALAATDSDATAKPLILDCQSHLFCADVIAQMERRSSDPRVFTRDGTRYVQMGDWLRKIPPHYLDVDVKLAAMDAAGIQMTALSINDPGPEWFGSDGPAMARVMNDFVADIVRRHPDRFIGLCVLPLQDMPAALAELDRAHKSLGMRGILLYTNLAGRFVDEAQFRPLFARATELDLPILLHPAKPLTTDVVKGYEMTSSLGNMFDNTIALTRIIMAGILDEFPGLKLVCPHLGGTLPYIVGRLDHQTQVLKRGPKYLQQAPSEYLKRVWLDIVSPLPLAMKFGYDFMGPDRLLFASDHPWVQPSLILDGLRSLQLPADDEQKILGSNARKLFGVTA